MAARDNVLFTATVASGTAAGTVVPLSLLYGVENVRQGYGTPKLKSARAYYWGGYSDQGIPIEIKNSNWVDSAGLYAQVFSDLTAVNRNSLSFMHGRDKTLNPNTSWSINAILPTQSSSKMNLYVLLEIEYSDVQGINTENAAGSPILKTCANASVTGASNVITSLGSFDNLLQNVDYVLSEVSVVGPSAISFIVLEGFSNQKGLIRIFPAKNTGMADQIEGSVILKKQTYNVSIINSAGLSSAAVSVGLEMIANQN